jgi:ParB family chromosome partitioning protein
MQVIEEGVFLGAITVRRAGRVNSLIDGAHRLEAMSRLGRETIRADVLDCNASEARRLEVTGNLTAGMTPVQDAIFLSVYQAEYEKLHPETKGGVAGALARHGLQTSNMTFAEVIAETRQIKPRQVQKIIAAGRALSRDERDALQVSPHRIAISEIEKLGKIGDQSLRARAVEALLDGKKVASAIKAAKAEANGDAPAVKDPVEAAFIALSKAWARAPMAAKKRFVASQFEQLLVTIEDEALERDIADRLQEAGK